MIERETRSGVWSYALRFRAYGQRQFLHLGYAPDWTRKRAENELANVLADVRRGLWRHPDELAPQPPAEMPTFHVFASEWMAGRDHDGLRPRTVEYLRWALTDHLLPHFASKSLDAITIEEVDRYARAKAAAGKLSNRSVNKTLDVLSGVLETAVEYGHVQRNPAKGKRRRLPVSKQTRSYLDNAVHIAALMDGAGEVDRSALARHGQRRALLAVLAFAGLRIGEALDLRWADVNLADCKLRVRKSKTDAGVRVVDVLPVLRDELVSYRARLGDVKGSARVFGTTSGGRQSESNVRQRVLAKAVEHANAALEKDDHETLPVKLTPHSLRRTFASVLAALGEPMPSVIRQLGHTDPSLTLRIYAQDAARGDGERERLRALVEGREWAPSGTSSSLEGLVAVAEAHS